MTEHQDRDTRREQILDAATKMFVSRGYENSTVDDIAKEAGLSKGSIYWYFKSKLEILFALTDRCTADSQEELVNLAASKQFGTEALYKSHRPLIEGKFTKPEHDQLSSQLAALAPRYPEIRERLAVYYHTWDETAATLMERGMESGLFKQHDAVLLAQAITAMYDGLFLRRGVDPDLDVIAVLEQATKLFFDALNIPKTEIVAFEDKG